ncbi:MAG: ribosome silencing factor [Betaproteobacteria bacterium]|nr:ribosome silencing factor [Betaproteobacteria bacterium]NBY71856.1 ribosome silencing factor [Betaproteobacteria bacterium]NDD11890.1 ribosome silencing factor [Betaproteobacteria bacterium]
MTTSTTTADKKDVQKLQRAIVDGLEDVKALDIQVFNTEHLSPLFERVMIASGTSNRQTKALASSVRDAVRDAGFPKPRMEGEENGEWIIVDCGQAVVHIMQPAIRQYYHLEDLWGDKPVRLKFGAAKPALPTKLPVRQAVQLAAKTGGLKRSSAAKQGVELAYPSKAQEKRNATKKAAAKKVDLKKAAPRKTPAKTAPKTTTPTPAAKPVTKVTAKDAAKTRKLTD